jgi:hypothetical protein
MQESPAGKFGFTYVLHGRDIQVRLISGRGPPNSVDRVFKVLTCSTPIAAGNFITGQLKLDYSSRPLCGRV